MNPLYDSNPLMIEVPCKFCGKMVKPKVKYVPRKYCNPSCATKDRPKTFGITIKRSSIQRKCGKRPVKNASKQLSIGEAESAAPSFQEHKANRSEWLDRNGEV